jgi:tetratricopeptide (TPR) repeat protein
MRRGIRINRQTTNLHFKPHHGRARLLFFLAWLAAMAVVIVVIWRFDAVQPQVLAMVQPPAPTLTAPTLARQGYEAYMAGDLPGAERLLGQSVQMDPAIDTLYEYGRMLLLQDKGDAGLAVADQAITLASDDPRGYALKVYALDILGRAEEAIPFGLTALEIDPNFAPTYAFLSGAYQSTARWGTAREMGARAVELDPNNLDARRQFAFALNWIGRYDLVVEQLEAAIQLNPNLDFLYFELAGAFSGLKNYSAMIGIYEHVLALQPENTKAMVRMCETYFTMRIDNYAQYWCEQALDRDPNDSRALKQVGMIYYTRRNYESSIEAFDQCVSLSGAQYIECWYLRGLAYYRLGECEIGIPILQEALNYTQDDLIRTNILDGLYLCVEADPRYDESVIPTPAPTPTAVPTPIGIF